MQQQPSSSRIVINVRKLKRIAFVILLLGFFVLWLLEGVQFVLRFLLFAPFWGLTIISFLLFALRRKKGWLIAGFLTFLIALLGTPIRMVWWAGTFEQQFASEPILSLQNFYHRRIIPREVADHYARRSLTDSRYVLGELHPTMTAKGRLVWQAPVLPNSLEGKLSFGIDRVLEVLADTAEPAVDIYDIQLPWGGEGNFWNFHRLIAWWYDPLSEPQPPVYDVEHRVALIPLLRWYWRVPVFHGVFRVDSTGDFTFLSPEEAAAKYPHLRLFPAALIRWQAETWGLWRAGILSRYFTKEGLYEVADIGPNPAPLLLDNHDQSLWVVPMEPVGKSFGLTGLLFCDAVTGTLFFWNTADKHIMSPSRALEVALGYEEIAILKNTTAVEPKLTIANGKIYWVVPIVPLNASQIQKLALVDAASGKVRTFESYRAMWAFLAQPASFAASTRRSASSPTQQLQEIAQQLQELAMRIDSLRRMLQKNESANQQQEQPIQETDR